MSPGIFRLETADWWGGYSDTSTIRPILDLLGQGMDRKPRVIHRNVATREELAHHLGRWRRTRSFPLLFLSFHGAPGRLYLGNHRAKGTLAITLDDVADMIGHRCSGRLVHFGFVFYAGHRQAPHQAVPPTHRYVGRDGIQEGTSIG